eukprot:scaffold6021_cov117-Isochrysis_galbana.AAC.12
MVLWQHSRHGGMRGRGVAAAGSDAEAHVEFRCGGQAAVDRAPELLDAEVSRARAIIVIVSGLALLTRCGDSSRAV